MCSAELFINLANIKIPLKNFVSAGIWTRGSWVRKFERYHSAMPYTNSSWRYFYLIKPEDFEKGAKEDVEKEEEKPSEMEEDESNKEQQDVVFIQDVGFTVKIVAPSVEPFDIQVSWGFFKYGSFKVSFWLIYFYQRHFTIDLVMIWNRTEVWKSTKSFYD